MTDPDQILSQFIDAWNAGRRPRVLDHLERLPPGPARDELAAGIATWLEVAHTPVYDEQARAAIRADPVVARVLAAADDDGGLWPTLLPRLRARAGLSVRDLAARVVDAFGLGSGAQERAADYLQRMERGELESSRVSRRLLDRVGEILGASGSALADAGGVAAGARPASAGTLFRAGAPADEWMVEEIEALSRAAMTPAPEAMDELDRLFTGGRDA